MKRSVRWAIGIFVVVAMVGAGCGNDDDGDEGAPSGEAAGVPTVIATTSIWSDVVANVACNGLAEVTTLIPPGGDPHTFQPSLQDRGEMEAAVMIVANGLELEEGLEDTLEAVEEAGTPVFHFAEHMETIGFSEGMELDHHDEEGEDDHGDDDEDEDEDHHEEEEEEEEDHHEEEEEEDDDHGEEEEEEDDDHGEEEEEEDDDHGEEEEEEEEDHHEEEEDEDEGDDHGDEDEDEGDDHGDEDEDEGDDHGEEEGHGHGSEDPHVWFDPIRVADALPALTSALAALAGLDAAALDECAAQYRSELIALDAEIDEILEPLHHDERFLLTNHDALGYFADRYEFQVVGAVIPGGSSLGETNPAQLQELVGLIDQTGVSAIFAESTTTSQDADALGREANVQVVTLDTGSLGQPGSGADTYIGFMRSNAQKIADGLS